MCVSICATEPHALQATCMHLNHQQGVESEECPGFSASMDAGKLVKVNPKASLADGLAVPMVGINTFAIAKANGNKVITVRYALHACTYCAPS